MAAPRHVAGLDSVLNTGVRSGRVGEPLTVPQGGQEDAVSYDELFVRATQHQAELRREAEVDRLVRRRELKPGRTFRIVPPPAAWPLSVRDNEEVAA